MGNICFRNQSDSRPIEIQRGTERFDPIGGQRSNPRQIVRPYPDSHHRNILGEGTNQETVIVRALYNYVPRTSDDLPFELGEELDVDKKYTTSGRDWWFARSRLTGRTGYIPRNYVADITSLEAEPWYFGNTKRSEAEKKLLTDVNTDGTFLIRTSETRVNDYSLSIRFDNTAKHYRIRRSDDDQYYIVKTRQFHSLKDLVKHYSHKIDGLCTKLKQPCRVIGQPSTEGLSYITDQDWEISRTSIKLIEKLGQGAFGEVYRGIWNNTTPVAVKTMKQGTMSGIEFLKEAAIMKKLRHPKLIQLYAICKTEPIYIVTELMENGSLLDYLRDKERGHKLHLPQLIDITAQVACGMAYLETQNYIHRDLAARNVLVGENLECKVADFGLARDDLYATRPEGGTKLPIKWTAPEALIYSKFSIKSDVWSFGILMYEVITYGGQPYIGMKGQDVINKIQSGYRLEPPSNCPDHYYNLMLECWQKEPEDRLTFRALQTSLEHFFEDKDSYLDDQ